MRFGIAAVMALLAAALPTSSDAAERNDPAQTIVVARSGSQPSAPGPAEYFTGAVRVEPLFRAGPSDTSAAYVRFEARARSAWHTHPLGQILIVTDGVGWIQRWGEPIEEMRVGDVVWIPPHQKHWHGASSGSAMTHIAITSAVSAKNVDWMEKVSEAQYMAGQPESATSVTPTRNDVRSVATALERFTHETLNEVWKRPGLSARDRSLVTLAVLIARNQTTELPVYLNRALESGVKASEISEVITHLAFYSGWGSGMSAVAAVAHHKK
jgi:4-carboxymuconolactone decarboxylase